MLCLFIAQESYVYVLGFFFIQNINKKIIRFYGCLRHVLAFSKFKNCFVSLFPITLHKPNLMSKKNTKYIFVTGGVTSSLGKGIVSASLGLLLKSRGFNVTIQKLDPYINIDPGTLNPYEHGECYVTEDGAETDLDLGHYERYLDAPTSQNNNVTTGKIYQTVIEKERKGDFLGKTVQVIPHITNEIKRRIKILSKQNYDIIITEIGELLEILNLCHTLKLFVS